VTAIPPLPPPEGWASNDFSHSGDDLDHDRFPAFRCDGVARPYFAGSSLILSPPFATGMTQSGVATSAELRSDV
jgi:hypothetical protein